MAFRSDPDSFLNAFTRFTSRSGEPKVIVSDYGTNFVGAVNELKELVSELDPRTSLSKAQPIEVQNRTLIRLGHLTLVASMKQ